MKKTSGRPKKFSFRVVISAAGSVRSESDLRKDVTQALEEATGEFRSQSSVANKVRSEGTPQGAFLGLGAEWPWIISVLTPIAWEFLKEASRGAAEELGKEGAKNLFSLFEEALRKRNLSAGTPVPLPTPTSKPTAKPKSSPKKKARMSR